MSTHRPIEEEHRAVMNEIASLIDGAINQVKPKEYGFALLVFRLGEDPGLDPRMNYISNARRADMLTAMKEFIARNEGMDPTTPETVQ